MRPAVDADAELLSEVYASGRWHELAAVPWDDESTTAFLRSQDAALEQHLRMRHPGAERLVVEVDGRAVGRLYRVELPGAELRLLDLVLLPYARRRGIGTRLVQLLADEADARGLLLSLHVAHGNPAQGLYERHGFTAVAQDEVTVRMERPARPPS